MEATTQPTPVDATAQVRDTLHHIIDEINNFEVLKALLTIMDAAQPAAPFVDEAVRLEDLPPAERAAVEEGLKQLDAGQGRPHAEVWAEYEAKYGVKSTV